MLYFRCSRILRVVVVPLLLAACGDGGPTAPGQTVSTQLSFTGIVRIGESPVQGAVVGLTGDCANPLALVNCTYERSEDSTDAAGRYFLSVRRECVRGESLPSHWGLGARIPIDRTSWTSQGVRHTELRCTKEEQVFDFSTPPLALELSGRVLSENFLVRPYVRAVWESSYEQREVVPVSIRDREYRMAFLDCPVGEVRPRFYIQALESGSRSERYYITSCDPVQQRIDLTLSQ